MANNQPEIKAGVLIVNKHAGVTSHRIISSCRKLFGTRQVGHTGTLDPMATGVLPILIGRAVKASDYLMMHDKEYICEMKLGLTTDTEDITGEILTQSGIIPDEDTVLGVIRKFQGKIKQIPPMYSAVKVGGRKLVDIAREGGEVEREARDIEIYAIDARKISDDTYSMRVECSKGTYIRTLCSDIGKALGCGAVMSSLIRTKTGSFTLDQSVTVEELDNMTPEEREARLIPVEELFASLPELNVPDFYAKLVRGGTNLFQKKLKSHIEDGQLCRIRNKGEFIALGRGAVVDGEAVIRPEKLFVIDPVSSGATNENKK